MKNLIRLLSLLTLSGLILTSCEGPQGMAGKDANESCKECHNTAVVQQKSLELAFSKHEYGEAAFEEGGNTGCTPCHAEDAFQYVTANNTPSTFTLLSTGKYRNDYFVPDNSALGEFTCFTCHSNLHTSYTGADFQPLTWTGPVAMTMWKGTKTINIASDGGSGNLCVKCHQPRPLTTSTSTSNGDVVDYVGLATTPSAVFYDAAVGNAAPNKVIPSYRTHVHYGTIGAVYGGQGGVQFTGTQAYTSSSHTTVASCSDCHNAEVTGRTGGHTFRMRAEGALSSSSTWNFKGCNVAGCHSSPIDANNTTFWKNPRTEIQGLLNTLATKINNVGAGTPILHSDSDGTTNLWAGITSGNYDGYLNIYDPSTNALGVWRNPAPASSWTSAQKATNSALPVFPSLKNGVMGAMINFQMCLREYSLGIHNYKYAKALIQNSIETLTALGL
jgi:hypothetical protein